MGELVYDPRDEPGSNLGHGSLHDPRGDVADDMLEREEDRVV
jgi:hypothetical protein